MTRAAQQNTVRQVASTRLPTRFGTFQVIAYERAGPAGRNMETALAIALGDLIEGGFTKEPPLLRIHSQCFTGEVLGSLRCDCGEQLEIAMGAIAQEGRGLVIYEHQEGRGIGLLAKLQAYALQDTGLDTVEANHALGFEADCRDFSLPAAILHELGISRVRLLTNNQCKVSALRDAGIEVATQLPCEAAPTLHSLNYLRTKKEKMGHSLTVEEDNGKGHRESPRSSRPQDPFTFASVESAIRELQAGRMIVVVDDEDRENEGDLTMVAEMITPEAINFMATHGRGLICLAMTGGKLDQLDLPPMAEENSALHGTAFTISIDAKVNGVTTGISAHDRAQTIKTAVHASCRPNDLARPGHVFPLRARSGGVLERRGQTEAAVDLARLAGFNPAGVICEIVNEDGTMARVPDLVRFCQMHGLLMITVADLARYRLEIGDEWIGLFDVLSPEHVRDALSKPNLACASVAAL